MHINRNTMRDNTALKWASSKNMCGQSQGCKIEHGQIKQRDGPAENRLEEFYCIYKRYICILIINFIECRYLMVY